MSLGRSAGENLVRERPTMSRRGEDRRSTRGCRLAQVTCIALLALLATGCGRVTFGSTFREDGAATHEVEVVFERASIVARDAPAVQRALEDAEQRARTDGFATTRIDTPDQLGLRVTGSTRDATDAGAALNNIFDSLAGQSDEGPTAPFAGTFEKRGEAVGGTTYDLELSIDGPVLMRSVQRLAPGNRQFATSEGVAEVITFSYHATMPGDVKETNGEEAGQGAITWPMPLDEVSVMTASSTVGKDTPWLLTVVAIIAALVLVLVIGRVVMAILLRQRRARALQLADPGEPTLSTAASRMRTFGDVRDALTRLLQRLAAGLPLTQSHNADERSQTHGADPEGD